MPGTSVQLSIVIDTASLAAAPDSTPDKPVEFGHDGAFMMTDSTHCKGGNGTADLQLKNVRSGDNLQIWGSSLSNQFYDEVFIYDFQHWKDDTVLDTKGLRPQILKEDAMVPTAGGPSHTPPAFTPEPRSFPCTEIEITNHGTESFFVDFMVYGEAEEGGRKVKGYYRWDPSIHAI